IGGMETPVHNAFMLGAWYAFLKDKPRWIGAACALGVLTRPDALIWAIPLLLHQFWIFFRSRSGGFLQRIPLQTWLVGLVLVMPWVIFSALYFGTPIPHTVSTKASVYTLESTQALVTLMQHYAIPFQDQFTLGRVGVMIGIILYPALAAIGARWAFSRDYRALSMLLYPWIYFAVFAILNPLIFRWYLTPPLPAYFISIVCGVAALLQLLPERRGMLARGVLLAASIVTVLFTLNSWTLSPDHGANRPAPEMAFHELELNYADMARLLRRDYGVNEETILAAGDIGALGFYSRAHIFDTIGLVTEGTVPYYTPEVMQRIVVDGSNYAIPPDLILDRQPEFVVVMEWFVRKGLLQDEDFLQQYEQIHFIPTDYYGDGMIAYRRISDRN
ncbi:MAG TPA: hypothetical protein VJZ27_19740, partial [Aggregatilineales bacterium]|nr:hypothetical protein [Aggregatilineales bacterium]